MSIIMKNSSRYLTSDSTTNLESAFFAIAKWTAISVATLATSFVALATSLVSLPLSLYLPKNIKEHLGNACGTVMKRLENDPWQIPLLPLVLPLHLTLSKFSTREDKEAYKMSYFQAKGDEAKVNKIKEMHQPRTLNLQHIFEKVELKLWKDQEIDFFTGKYFIKKNTLETRLKFRSNLMESYEQAVKNIDVLEKPKVEQALHQLKENNQSVTKKDKKEVLGNVSTSKKFYNILGNDENIEPIADSIYTEIRNSGIKRFSDNSKHTLTRTMEIVIRGYQPLAKTESLKPAATPLESPEKKSETIIDILHTGPIKYSDRQPSYAKPSEVGKSKSSFWQGFVNSNTNKDVRGIV